MMSLILNRNKNMGNVVKFIFFIVWMVIIMQGLPLTFNLISETFPDRIATGLIVPLGFFYFGATIFVFSFMVASITGEIDL